MSNRTYVVVKGDEIEQISAKFYGTPFKWPLIWKASNFRSKNKDLIFPGEIAVIPDLTYKVKQKLTPVLKIQVDDQDIVTLLINDNRYSGWSANSIKRSVDSCADGFSLDLPWNPENEVFKRDFEPFGYQDVRLYIGNDLILNGKMEVINPVLDNGNREMNVQGRTVTAVLVDTSIENYPLQFRNQSLKQIASSLVEPYGLAVVDETENTGTFKKVIARNGESPFNFINNLAKKKGLLVSSTLAGELLLLRANPNGLPVANLIEGQGAFENADINFNGVNRFSSYTAIAQSRGGKYKIKKTAKDNSVKFYRPKIFEASDAEKGNIQNAAKWKRSTALAESIGLTINVLNWRKPDGSLWLENEIVNVSAPSLMIYKLTAFLIRQVEYTDDVENGKAAVLNLILPQAYTLDFPEVFPWQT